MKYRFTFTQPGYYASKYQDGSPVNIAVVGARPVTRMGRYQEWSGEGVTSEAIDIETATETDSDTDTDTDTEQDTEVTDG